MVLLESKHLPIGTTMPDFTLSDPNGTSFSRNALMGTKGLLIIFTCNHCPYAKAIWPRTIDCANDAANLGVNTVAINPNIHPDYPADSPEAMLSKINEWGLSFPYLVDDSQLVAKQYDAQCTPDIYLLAHDSSLFYHGRLDDNWQDEHAVTSQDVNTAIQMLISGEKPPTQQWPSIGCSIKWQD